MSGFENRKLAGASDALQQFTVAATTSLSAAGSLPAFGHYLHCAPFSGFLTAQRNANSLADSGIDQYGGKLPCSA